MGELHSRIYYTGLEERCKSVFADVGTCQILSNAFPLQNADRYSILFLQQLIREWRNSRHISAQTRKTRTLLCIRKPDIVCRIGGVRNLFQYLRHSPAKFKKACKVVRKGIFYGKRVRSFCGRITTGPAQSNRV